MIESLTHELEWWTSWSGNVAFGNYWYQQAIQLLILTHQLQVSNLLYTRPRTCTPRIARVPEFPFKFHRTPHLMLYLHIFTVYLQLGWNHHPFSAYVTFDCSSAEWWMYRGRLNSFASSDSFLRCQVRKDEPGNQGSLGVGSHRLVQN